MKLALFEAKKSGLDIPVGAVIVRDGEIIAKAHNLKEKTNDATAHAEIIALKKAQKKIKNFRLLNCDIYVTLEPCPMCAWAILNSFFENIYFGAYDLNYGAFGSKINLINYSKHKPKIYGGLMEDKCAALLNGYFSTMRKK